MTQSAMRSYENCAGQMVYAVPNVDRVRSRNVDIIRIKLIGNGMCVKAVGNNSMI